MAGGIKRKTGSGSSNIKPTGQQGKKAPTIFDKPIFSFQNVSNNNSYESLADYKEQPRI